MMMHAEQNLKGDQAPDILRDVITAYFELFQLRGSAEVAHFKAAEKVRVFPTRRLD